MSESIIDQIEALKQSIAALETQRNTLGDSVVKAALLPLQEKLVELESLQQGQQRAGQPVVAQQRKQVTILFMDIVNSTRLVSGMDPEEAMEIFDSALKRLGRVVETQEGRVTRYMGDGLMAVFGAPIAREDDPQRAVRAGLGLVEEAKRAGEEMGMTDFCVRVGVNTGLVAVGGQTEAEDTLMGSVVNLASRLESAAPVSGVLISHETYRHVSGLFNIINNEPVMVKGITEPVRSYRVLQAKARSLRQPMRGVEGLETRLVGRDGELKCLQDALLNTLESGEGQVVTISGEAGLGKSRLLEEFQNWFELRPEYVWLDQGRGRVEGLGQPYGLLREIFANRFEILENDTPETVREKFVHGLNQALNEQVEMKAHLLGQMLGYDFRDSPHLKGVLGDGEQLRNRGMMYFGEYFVEMSRQRPVVMLLEDIHWADDSTLDAVDWLEERMSKLRMLIVCAGREALYERRPYWGEGEERHTQVRLKPLTKRESRELVEHILRNVTHLPEDLRDLIVENAEGNPFYLEELIKMLIEDGVIVKGEIEWRVEPERLQETNVPSTLTGVLQARLDGLPAEERIVLQEASVVGRQFWDGVVAYVHTGGKPEAYAGRLQERLSSLRGRELIFRREISAFAEAREYLFKHDVLREVTYESVLKKVRRAHHALVADWLIANAGARISEYAGLIGEHLALGGRGQEAVTYLVQAGEAAVGAYASREAEGFYRRALELKPVEIKQAAIMQGLGKALNNQDKREEAIQVLQQGIELYRMLGDQDGLAQTIYLLADTLWRFEYQDAFESWLACQQATMELEGAPDSPGLARLLGETGRAAYFTHQPMEVTATYCQQAIEMAERLGLVDAQLNASITLGLANPDVDESIRIFEQAAFQAEAHGLLEVAARAYINLGSWKERSFNYTAGCEYHRKALEFYNKAASVSIVLPLLTTLVEDYLVTGRMKEVPLLATEFLEGANVSESRARDCQRDIAQLIHYSKGEWEQALELSRSRLVEARARGDLPAIIIYNTQIYDVEVQIKLWVGQGDLSEAETALRENLEIINTNPSLGDRVENLFFLAQVKALQNKLEQARRLLTDGEQSMDQNNFMQMINRDLARCIIAQTEKHWQEAIEISQSFLDHLQDSGASWYQAWNKMGLGDSLLGRDNPGDRELARQSFRQALDLFSEMGAHGYVQVLHKRLESLPAEST
jgi:class 3 adenylate cyclase/tetratricopeptide (TPR) repeat protein